MADVALTEAAPNNHITMDFRDLHGVVYILENSNVQRVKIGMSLHNVIGRLRDINDMWLERKVTCQICARRIVNVEGQVPPHAICGRRCRGGNAPPLERDVALAESYLTDLKDRHGQLFGSAKGSATRLIETLGKRIELYRNYERPLGEWQFSTDFYTQFAGRVELIAHELLAERLDKRALFGEVFCCSVSEATEAVESALARLGLIGAAVRRAFP